MMIFYNFLLDDEIIKEKKLWLMLYDVIEEKKT